MKRTPSPRTVAVAIAVAVAAVACLLFAVATFLGRGTTVRSEDLGRSGAPPGFAASPVPGAADGAVRAVAPATVAPPGASPAAAPAATPAGQGFLYGRVTGRGGGVWEGRLRFGGDQEAFWNDAFNGRKTKNPWGAQVEADRLPRARRPLVVFGLEIARRHSAIDLSRPFMARFGDLARIEARGGDVRVTWKSGAVADLDRLEASDFDDGLRVWDRGGGVVDLDSLRIAAIEFLPTPPLAGLPRRLAGTVRSRAGDFTGWVQWNREDGLLSDELEGRAPGGPAGAGPRRLPYGAMRAIVRSGAADGPEEDAGGSGDGQGQGQGQGVRVTLRDGTVEALAGTPEAGAGHRGLAVDDPRFGRVLVAWQAFERLDILDTDADADPAAEGEADSALAPGPGGPVAASPLALARSGSGPRYEDFPPGGPITGSVTTRAGRRLAGRLVYDLDESERAETLDAADARVEGIDYSLAFGSIASIVLAPGDADAGVPAGADVTLHTGATLRLAPTGDLAPHTLGVLVLPADGGAGEFVPWIEIGRLDLD